MKKELTANEIMELVGISNPMFYRLKKTGVIPPPDNTDRKPHVWYSSNKILRKFINNRSKRKAVK